MSNSLYLIPLEKSNDCCFFVINSHIFYISRLSAQPAAYEWSIKRQQGDGYDREF